MKNKNYIRGAMAGISKYFRDPVLNKVYMRIPRNVLIRDHAEKFLGRLLFKSYFD